MSPNDTPVSAPAGPGASSLSHETVVEMLSTLSDEATHPFTLRSLRENDAALRAALAAAESRAAATEALEVLTRLADSAAYWSEYDVPVGIVAEIDEAKARLAGVLS